MRRLFSPRRPPPVVAPAVEPAPEPEAAPAPTPQLRTDEEIVALAFDRKYYLSTNPDVAGSPMDPLEHFMTYGWRERRDPTPDFSVEEHLLAFPEVEASGVNPFVHYLTNGRPRIRPQESRQGFRYQILQILPPVADRLKAATKGRLKTRPMAELAAALAESREGLAGAHVTFSHDDFSANLGGLQASIQREAARVAELGRDHLHIYPGHAWTVVRTAADRGVFGVVWNGVNVGLFTAKAIIGALTAATSEKKGAPPAAGRSFAIHSLLGHTADEVADILAAVGLSRGHFWLHDFASLCAGFHLQRNDVADCAAPPPGSMGCSICVYGPWRQRHLDEHARLFARLDLTVAAPSQVTLDLWRASTDLPAAATFVLPHATLTPREAAPAREPGPFRLAYVGLPVAHKGWPLFKALWSRFADDPRYSFVHLGARPDPDPEVEIEFHTTAAAAGDPLAMSRALQAAGADAALIWPLCRETFSLVAYETVAAGCAVITGPDSGNVQAFVTETGLGRVLDEDELRAAFDSGDILDLARDRRSPMLYDIAFGALTLDLVS